MTQCVTPSSSTHRHTPSSAVYWGSVRTCQPFSRPLRRVSARPERVPAVPPGGPPLLRTPTAGDICTQPRLTHTGLAGNRKLRGQRRRSRYNDVCCAFWCSTCIHGTVRCTNPGPALGSRHRRVERRKLHVSGVTPACTRSRGCGTSSLSNDLYAEGVSPIISIDYSPICIKEMTERNAGIPEISWMVMDARQLTFPDKSFDLVIEKGTLDSMMVDEKDPWNITPATVNLVDEVLSEVSRVLTPSGCFISVTFSPPHFRTRHYAQLKYDWSVSCDTYGTHFHYFLYTMLKEGKLTPYDIERGQSLHKPRVIPDTVPTISTYEDEDFLRNIQI